MVGPLVVLMWVMGARVVCERGVPGVGGESVSFE